MYSKDEQILADKTSNSAHHSSLEGETPPKKSHINFGQFWRKKWQHLPR